MKMDTLTEFKVWLQSVHTHPYIQCFLYYGILSWLTLDPYTYQTSTTGDPTLHIIFRTQILIGWEALLNGFVTNGLITYQQKYYTDLGMKKQVTHGELN